MQKLFGCLLLALCLTGALGIDLGAWCGMASCGAREHITCSMPDEAYGPNCPTGAVILDLTPVQANILDLHNSLRNVIAGGAASSFTKASHMGTLRWNVTFGNLARRNVKLCAMQHDGCRNTPDFNFVGQNVGYQTYNTSMESPPNNLQMIRAIINSWYSQNQYANMAAINSYVAAINGQDISSFAQLVRDYVTRVGCAALKLQHVDAGTTTLLFTCNYDLALFKNYPVYDTDAAATTSGSKCTTGMNPTYPNLCSSAENQDPNNFFNNYV